MEGKKKLTNFLLYGSSSFQLEKDTQSEELSRLYREKDELCERFVASRDETLRLNSELADKMMKICSLETEISTLKEPKSNPNQKSFLEESTRELEFVETGRKISSLKLRISELESDLKTKEIICQQQESQLKSLHESLSRSKQKYALQRSKLNRMSRTKDELTSVVSSERDLFISVTAEMVKTMGELQGLVDAKSALGS